MMNQFGGRVRYEEFGLESVLRSHNQFAKTRSDIVVLWLHYVMLRNLFKAHGGEGALTELRTEQLPRNLCWNGIVQRYLIKYESKYIFYGLGVWIRGEELDCSLVSLKKSLRIGIPLEELVRDDLTLRDDVVDTFTDIIERTFVWPMMKDAPVPDPLYEKPQG